MGKVKELAAGLAEAGMELIELQDSGIGFAFTGDPTSGFSWYLAPDGSEYTQADWIFHALRHGSAASISEAVEGLGQAARALFPDCPYAMARTPKQPLRRAG